VIGQQDAADATVGILKAIDHPLARQGEILVDVCSYAGTGNVLKVQAMLHICTDHSGVKEPVDADAAEPAEGAPTTPEDAAEAPAPAPAASSAGANEEPKPAPDMTHQALAVIGIALVAMGEDVGAEMALRHFQHLVRLPSASGNLLKFLDDIWRSHHPQGRPSRSRSHLSVEPAVERSRHVVKVLAR
jgi:26S proteasome regulatory subunit N1